MIGARHKKRKRLFTMGAFDRYFPLQFFLLFAAFART